MAKKKKTKKIVKKYLLMGGIVRSASDGDRHFIAAHQQLDYSDLSIV